MLRVNSINAQHKIRLSTLSGNLSRTSGRCRTRVPGKFLRIVQLVRSLHRLCLLFIFVVHLLLLSHFCYAFVSPANPLILRSNGTTACHNGSSRAAYETARSSSIDSRRAAVSRKEQGERRRQEAAILRLRRTWRKRRATNYSFDNDQALVKATSRHCYTRARAISLASTRSVQSSNDVSTVVKFHTPLAG